jgi:hypothetical protein
LNNEAEGDCEGAAFELVAALHLCSCLLKTREDAAMKRFFAEILSILFGMIYSAAAVAQTRSDTYIEPLRQAQIGSGGFVELKPGPLIETKRAFFAQLGFNKAGSPAHLLSLVNVYIDLSKDDRELTVRYSTNSYCSEAPGQHGGGWYTTSDIPDGGLHLQVLLYEEKNAGSLLETHDLPPFSTECGAHSPTEPGDTYRLNPVVMDERIYFRARYIRIESRRAAALQCPSPNRIYPQSDCGSK